MALRRRNRWSGHQCETDREHTHPTAEAIEKERRTKTRNNGRSSEERLNPVPVLHEIVRRCKRYSSGWSDRRSGTRLVPGSCPQFARAAALGPCFGVDSETIRAEAVAANFADTLRVSITRRAVFSTRS